MLSNGLIDIFTEHDEEYGNVNLVQDIFSGNRETIKNETHISGLKKPAQKKNKKNLLRRNDIENNW